MIGVFYRDKDHSLKYLPSVDFMEAGKFKFRQSDDVIDGLRSEAIQTYKEQYEAKLTVS